MQYTNLTWRNGQPYSELFDDIYYSSNENESVSGESEFNHVFFKHNGLPERWKKSSNFVIAELGFGSGLNCILTIREWLKHVSACNKNKCLHYIAIEKHPLSPQAITELISQYAELKKYCDELIENYPPAVEATHSRRLFNNRVVIHFKFMDVFEALKDENLSIDAWYLDGFSPEKNPAMWSEKLFARIAQNSHIGSTCSTYTSAGFVKRNLQSAGFTVNKVSGYGKKREMLVAELSNKLAAPLKYKDKPWFKPPLPVSGSVTTATIIGAGIAGLSLAYILVQRGWSVTIVEKHGEVAKETSANPAAIVYPRLSVDNDVDSKFYTAAYCYVLYTLKKLQKNHQQQFWFDDGLLQLMDNKRITAIIKKFQFNAEYVSIVDELNSGQDYVNYSSAGVVLPGILCDVLKTECGKKLDIINAEITDINYDGQKWQCLSNSQVINEAEILIIANGTEVNELGLSLDLPVEGIRGQIVILKANSASQQIKKTLNADVHITPAINGKHYLGATYTRKSGELDIDQNDTMKLLESLNTIYPELFKEEDVCGAWAGLRTVAKDRKPIVGAVADEHFFSKEYADICNGNTTKIYQPAHYLKGLYISAAHGSRGFTSSFLSAEIIASLIEGEPVPVNKNIMDYLSPSRFIVNNLKRR
jgi:tRNA 5-methylaminomethyl-2-thiouridine biosynthesis bifunctional protein